MRIAFFIDGTFIPERDGASTRFARLPAAICRSGVGVCVFHAFRGWSRLERIANEPYPTYFFRPGDYYGNLDILVRLVKSEQIDIVQMNDLETIQNVGLPLAKATGVRLVYEALYHSSTLAGQLGLPDGAQAAIQSLERTVASSVDHIITFSEPDLQRWHRSSNTAVDRLSIVPFGADVKRRIEPRWVGRPSVTFVGNGYFEPNRRAVGRIVSDIWPALRARRPDATCLIIGDMPQEIRTACLGVGIDMAGEVAEPGAFLRTCAIGLAPVSEGSGIRVKLLSYLASGLPAIATSAAAEGLAFPALVIEDRMPSYVDLILDLASDSDRVGRLVLESLDLLEREFTWNQIAESAKDTYRRVMDRPIRRRPAVSSRVDGVPMWLDEALRSGRFAGGDDLAGSVYSYGVARDGTVSVY
jgi:glycosyltransferase involved in cell wall biosynthesis